MSVKYKKTYDILDDKKIVGFVERGTTSAAACCRVCRYRAWLYCKGGVDEFLLLEQEDHQAHEIPSERAGLPRPGNAKAWSRLRGGSHERRGSRRMA